MPTQIDPIWADILTATQQPGDYEVNAHGGDIVVSGARLEHLQEGSSLRILGGKLIWASGTQDNHPLFKLQANNIHLSASMKIDHGGYGMLAQNVDGLDLDLQVKGSAVAYVKAKLASQPLPLVSGMGARLEGVRKSKVRLVANGTLGGLYALSVGRRSEDLDLETYLTDVALGNTVISASRVKLKTRVHSWEDYGAHLGSGQNGDGITIDNSEDMDIDALICSPSCYGVAIGPISGAPPSPRNRNIRFSDLTVVGGVTSGLLANGVDDLYFENLDLSCEATAVIRDTRMTVRNFHMLPDSNPLYMLNSDVRIGGKVDLGGNSPWYTGSNNTVRIATL